MFWTPGKTPARSRWLGWEEQEWVGIKEFLEFWVGILAWRFHNPTIPKNHWDWERMEGRGRNLG